MCLFDESAINACTFMSYTIYKYSSCVYLMNQRSMLVHLCLTPFINILFVFIWWISDQCLYIFVLHHLYIFSSCLLDELAVNACTFMSYTIYKYSSRVYLMNQRSMLVHLCLTPFIHIILVIPLMVKVRQNLTFFGTQPLA